MSKLDKKLLFKRMNSIGQMPVNEGIISKSKLTQMAENDKPVDWSDEEEKHDKEYWCIKIKDTISLMQKLCNMLEGSNIEDIPAWIQNKLAISHHNAEALHDYYLTQVNGDDHDEVLHDNEFIKEYQQNLLEKNVPNDPQKWSYAKGQAKKKFDVYPSAYANAWASKKYKELGGTWRKKKS